MNSRVRGQFGVERRSEKIVLPDEYRIAVQLTADLNLRRRAQYPGRPDEHAAKRLPGTGRAGQIQSQFRFKTVNLPPVCVAGHCHIQSF